MKRNPATEATARRLLRAVRGVKKARRAVTRAKAAVNRKPRRRLPVSARERTIRRVLRALPDYPREFVEEVLQADGTLRRPRNMPEDVWHPLASVLGQAPRRAAGARRPPPADELERVARQEEAAEFQERLARAGHGHGRLRAWRNPPGRRIRAAGRALELEVAGRELVAVHGKGAAEVQRALALFRKWSRREPGAVDVVPVPPGTPPVLVALGELTDIGYRSDKWGGKRNLYIHRTEPPRPVLCATPDGRRVVILGGGLKVRPEGLVG